MPEDMMQYLVEEAGLPEEDARLRLQDDDLWILHPDQRWDADLQGEEGVRAWEEAAHITSAVADIVRNGPRTLHVSPAITHLVRDLDARAQEALRRARERHQEALRRAGRS